MDYTTLATNEELQKAAAALQERGAQPVILNTKVEALAKIKELIPAGVSVMNGASKTLEQIGFVDYLKLGEHGWNNLHAAIVAEKDPIKQGALRQQSVNSDYYLGSVHALSQTGEMVIASASGSQLPHLAFTSPNIILVVGAQKITPTLTEALRRVEDYVFPLEDERAKNVGYGGSILAKILILNREHPKMGRKVHVIFVNEQLGF